MSFYFILGLLPLAIVLSIALTSEGTRRIVTWRNLEEFYKGGWGEYFEAEQPSIAFSKPSEIHSSFAPLDSGVTGDGVWCGKRVFSLCYFINFTALEHFENIIGGNVTINYFYAPERSKISFAPCMDSENGRCNLDGAEPLEWKTANFKINRTQAETFNNLSLKADSYGGNPVFVLNEVSFSYETDGLEPEPTTEDSNRCNESCEYRAIDCHNYYSCIDYSYKKYFTCAEEDGLAFNPEIGMCDRMEFVEGCVQRCEYRPDYNNCSNYYFCPNSVKEDLCKLRSCPHGLLYSVDEDSGVQQCTVPSKANCATSLNNA